jgi:uncharacterized iron-regulated protein
MIPLQLLALGGLLVVMTSDPLSADDQFPAFEEWQVLEVRTGRLIAFENLLAATATADVIYIGEEHRHRFHIEAALRILQALRERNRRPVLGLEMFGWDGQAGLDRYLADAGMERERFLQEAKWKENWGGGYEDYAPLINFARMHHVPVLALNPPKPLVRRVAREGLLQARSDPEMIRWGLQDETFWDDPAYRALIIKQLRLCHGGLSESAYERMYDGSMFRDEGMAKTISESLDRFRNGLGPVVSYTGAGHMQYGLPVPSRVQRRQAKAIRQTTIYLASLEPGQGEEIRDLLRESIADYVWLTPLSAHGPTPRCR